MDAKVLSSSRDSLGQGICLAFPTKLLPPAAFSAHSYQLVNMEEVDLRPHSLHTLTNW